MKDNPERARREVLRQVEGWLRKRGSPRLHMLLIVSATGALGFLSSFLMLKAGVSTMALRYPLAVGLSYLAFLALLRLWLGLHMTAAPADAGGDGYGLADAVLDMPSIGPVDIGGGFSGDVSPGDAIGALDLDELFFVVVAVAAIGAGLLVCLYLVWAGPTLLAEVLVDGIVMSRIYRRMKIAGETYWMSGVLRRTWLPAISVAIFLAVAGFAMQKIAPDAKSIGPVAAHVIGNMK